MRRESYFGPESINYFTTVTIIQQICPFLVAIFGLLIIPFLDKKLTQFLEVKGKLGNNLAVCLGVITIALSLMIFFVASSMLAFYIANYRGHMNWPGMQYVWTALSIDVFLIGIFLQWLYSLYRRWYAAILIFLLYSVIIAIIGADQRIVLMGFGTTTPVRFSLHEEQPIGFEAAMMLRVYWTWVTLVFLVALTGLDDRRQGMLAGGLKSLRAGVLDKGNWLWFLLMGLAGFAAIAQGQTIAGGLQKITRFYASDDRDGLKAAESNSDRMTVVRLAVTITASLDRERVSIKGLMTLKNEIGAPMSTVLLEKAPISRVGMLSIDGDPTAKIRIGLRTVLIQLSRAIPPDADMKIRYQTFVDASDPFDQPAQAAVLPHAFFLDSAVIFPTPRRLACLNSVSENPMCTRGENYQLSDRFQTDIAIDAPSTITVANAMRGNSVAGRTMWSLVFPPEGLGNLYVAASRFRMSKPRAGGLTVAFLAPFSRAVPDQVATYIDQEIDAYSRAWRSIGQPQFWMVEAPAWGDDAISYHHGFTLNEQYMLPRVGVEYEMGLETKMLLSHETAHQWWGYIIVPAHARGSDFVLESLAQFAALHRVQAQGLLSGQDIITAQMNGYNQRKANPLKTVRLGEKQTDYIKSYFEDPLFLLAVDQQMKGNLINDLGTILNQQNINSGKPIPPSQIIESLRRILPPSISSKAPVDYWDTDSR
jgi:hypothetical protein